MIVSSSETLVRFASGGHIADGKIGGTAFQLKADEADGMSVSNLSVLHNNIDVALEALRKTFGSRLNVRKTGRFAEFTIQDVIAKLVEAHLAWDISYVSNPLCAKGTELADPSHGLILGLPASGTPEGEMVGDLIASVVIRLHAALPTTKV